MNEYKKYRIAEAIGAGLFAVGLLLIIPLFFVLFGLLLAFANLFPFWAQVPILLVICFFVVFATEYFS